MIRYVQVSVNRYNQLTMTNTDYAPKYAFILGTHAKLCLAELEAVLTKQGILGNAATEGAVKVKLERKEGVAFLSGDVPSLDAEQLMQTLGGTIKIVEMVGDFDPEGITDWLSEQINFDSKFHFGFSLYAIEQGVSVQKHWKTIHRMGLDLKKALKADEVSARYVQSKEIVLSSVIVHKERLLKNGVEMCLFKSKGGIVFGRTLAVQPFQDFSARDYGRPNVDARSGMLPPKLARMMVNLSGAEAGDSLLDPFCGSGTVLQEAALLGVATESGGQLIGSDISDKAIQDTRKNMEWLESEHGLQTAQIPLHITPADALIREDFMTEGSVQRIVFEGYLGPTTPYADKLPPILSELQGLYMKTFPVLAELLDDGGVLVAGLPFWSVQQMGKDGKNKYVERHLKIDKIVEASGLQLVKQPLLYRRQTATVGREILVLKKA